MRKRGDEKKESRIQARKKDEDFFTIKFHITKT